MDLGKFEENIVFLSFICSEIGFSYGNMFSASGAFLDTFKAEAPKYWFSYIEVFLANVLDKTSSSMSERLTEKFMHLKGRSLEFVKTSEMSGGTLYLKQHTFRAILTEYR